MSCSKHIISSDSEIFIPEKSFADYLLERLKRGKHDIAQISALTGEKNTYADILRASISLAEELKKIGCKKGDVVGIISENRFEFTICAIAIIFIGATLTTFNILYTKDELLHVMNISKPKTIFCSPLGFKTINSISDKYTFNNIITFEEETIQSRQSVKLYKNMIKNSIDIESFKTAKVDLKADRLFILYSSGTTGLPKGVALSQYCIAKCSLQFKTAMMMEPNQCVLIPLPWFHAYGLIVHLILLYLNIKYVFMTKFEETVFLKAIQDNEVTFAYLVPPLMVFLAKHPLVSNYDLSSLKTIICGAAPLSKEVQTTVTRKLPGLKRVSQAYGLTETTLGVMYNYQTNQKFGSCGKVADGVVAKIVDVETGKTLGPNKSGELCLKTDILMMGYVGDDASTHQAVDSEGWLHTGDISYYDEDYYFYIVDRQKELIKYKAFQVSPAEIETLLLQHPAIKEAGVIGIPDDDAGELPLAFVVIQPGATTTEKEIQDYVAKRISSPKRLRGGVRFIDEIPKNPSGKLLRRELKKLLEKHSSKL